METLYRQGRTLLEIAALYGVSKMRVWQVLRRRGVHRIDGGAHVRASRKVKNFTARRISISIHQ